MAKRQTVGVAEVRKHFDLPVTRGRLAQDKIAEYEAATGNKVETGYRPEKTVAVPVTKIDKRGRAYTRERQVPVSEARYLAGPAAGKRGVLSADALRAAGEALSDALPE